MKESLEIVWSVLHILISFVVLVVMEQFAAKKELLFCHLNLNSLQSISAQRIGLTLQTEDL